MINKKAVFEQIKEMRKYVRERDEALFSLDRGKINAFLRKHGLNYIADSENEMFWGAVYKAICDIPSAPKEVADKARAWLTERGLRCNTLTAEEIEAGYDGESAEEAEAEEREAPLSADDMIDWLIAKADAQITREENE